MENKKNEDILKNSKTLSDQKKKEIFARLDQEKEIDNTERPAGDVYSKIKGKDKDTGVEEPTDEAVEKAKNWVDRENQM